MKNIIWIDDNAAPMKHITLKLFKLLWEHEFTNDIIFVGDKYEEEGSNLKLTEQVLQEFQKGLDDQFHSFCYTRFKEQRKGGTGGTPVSLDSIYEKYERMRPKRPQKLNEYAHERKLILNKIKEIANTDNTGETYIGIDICLNKKDDLAECDTLSMYLFHELSNLVTPENKTMFKVFLYTRYENLTFSKNG